MKSVVLMPNWIGDLAMALAVVEGKRRSSDEELTLLVPDALVPLCRELTDLSIIPFARRGPIRKQALRQVRAGGFGRIYLIPYSFSSGWFAFRTGIRERIGLNRDGRGILLTTRLPESTRDRSQHIMREYAQVLHTPFVAPSNWTPGAIATHDDHAGAIGFCPGAKYGPAKKWPGYGALAQALTGERIVVLGGPDDREAGAEVVASAPDRVENLAGQTTLEELPHVIAALKLVVSNDSGLMHLAGYVGTPVVGIFGSTSPTWTRPVGAASSTVYAGIECSPCLDRECRFGHYQCLHDITVDEVAELCRRTLGEESAS